MESIVLYARAKINPTLDVIKKLDNGYHELNMIMQTVNLCDTLTIIKTSKEGVSVSTNLYWLPTDNRNLVHKIATYIKEVYNIKCGIKLNLFKRIPISAGLAGGSSDAAMALAGLRTLFDLPISDDELSSIGEKFGSDIPFCLLKGTALAKGIGNHLISLPPFPMCHILIAKPPVSVSTPSIFRKLKVDKITNHPDTEKVIHYITKNNLDGVAKNLCNVLEDVSIEIYPIIANIKQDMMTNGALGSIMSGSGASVFGIFKTKQQATIASNMLKYKYKHKLKDIFLTTPFNVKH